ncbi:nucleoporin Nup120/160-domain-containing protein [Salix suchowensis]|nr:nucleoporin Nup120/160-domain-containing protein [Salix suchowensis]
MNGSVLVAAQLSSIFPSAQAATLAIHTVRQKTPLPAAPNDSDPPPEHASFAKRSHWNATSTRLAWLVDCRAHLAVDRYPPNPFRVPFANSSSSGSICLGRNQLHLLAVTLSGSLYRVVIPLEDGVNLWKHQTDRFTYHEYLIKTIQEDAEGLVQIQGPHSVAIGLQTGELLRLESDSMGHCVSEASHPWPTDLGHVWTLSRDRTLRLWKAKIGCVASRSLALTENPLDLPHMHLLLETQNQQFLQVFSTGNETVYVLVFVPTVSSSTSGGSFRLFRTTSDQLHDEGTIECSPSSAHCHLQDFRVIDTNLYVLWDRQGQSMVERSVINTDTRSDRSGATPWYPATYAREPELTPAYLEELLLSPGSLTDKFFEAIMRPGGSHH